LSKEYKMDRSTIIRRIKDLEEKGYIRRMSTFRGTYLSLEFLNEEAENYLKEETKVEKKNI
jgi:DNA-binding MarR family transcriptional regulator